MAELGIAASGIGIASLAIQVGDCIVRLKKFWEEVKHAPEEIKNLMEEIETLSLVLSEFETSDQGGLNLGIESKSRCLQFCQKAAGILTSVVQEAENEIRGRRLRGSMKTVMKKDTIEKLRERLMTAQSMLMLSNQVYMLELQKRNQQAHHNWAQIHQQELQQLRIIVSQYTQTSTSSGSFQSSSRQALQPVETIASSYQSNSPARNDAPERKYQEFKSHSKRYLQLKARFVTPKWLLGVSRAIEIYESRAQAGWNFNIQVYNVVSGQLPIFRMAREGDVVGMQQLFSTGKASPFDRNQYGCTLLDIAAFGGKIGACRLLINEGADPNISVLSSATLIVACMNGLALRTSLELVQLLAQRMDVPDPFEDYSLSVDFCGRAEVLTWLLQHSNSMYQQRSLEELVLFTIKICKEFQPNMAGLVKTILKTKVIDATVCCTSDDSRNTILHCAAWNFGFMLAAISRQQRTKSEGFLDLASETTELSSLLILVIELVKGGSQLHALTVRGRTPMLQLIDGFFCCGSMVPIREVDMRVLLKAWLKQLKDSGVDLVEYGKEEKRVLESPAAVREFEYYIRELRGYSRPARHQMRLINFAHGPDPADWTFWFVPITQNYFMDFWDMIDHPERGMPGAWEEQEYDT